EGIPSGWGMTPDGRVVHQLLRFPFPGQPQSEFSTLAPIIARGTGGSSETLAVLRAGGTIRVQGGAMRIRLFEPEPVWDVAADGSLLTAMNTDYSIEVRRPGGTLVQVIRKPFERAPSRQRTRKPSWSCSATRGSEQGYRRKGSWPPSGASASPTAI